MRRQNSARPITPVEIELIRGTDPEETVKLHLLATELEQAGCKAHVTRQDAEHGPYMRISYGQRTVHGMEAMLAFTLGWRICHGSHGLKA